MAFVRVRLDVSRGDEEEEEGEEGEGGDGSSSRSSRSRRSRRSSRALPEGEAEDQPKSEQWEFLVRVAPPDAPGGLPRAVALRAAKLPSGPFGGSVAGISLSPGAETFSLVGNVSALIAGGGGGDEGGRGIDDTFVYPPIAMA